MQVHACNNGNMYYTADLKSLKSHLAKLKLLISKENNIGCSFLHVREFQL